MVDQIHFQKILPSVTTARKVKRAGSQNQERPPPSFSKFLKPNEDEDNEESKEKKAKQEDTVDDQSSNAEKTAGRADEPDNERARSAGKRIDVHV